MLTWSYCFADGDLSGELGFFGGLHFDKYDSLGGWSTMFANPDLPDDVAGWEGGRFHLVELGFYVRLDTLVAITFSGLRQHGGTPPLAPEGAEIPDWAYRWVTVLYPQGATLDGRVTMNIASNSDGTPLQLTPQMKDMTSPKPDVEL